MTYLSFCRASLNDPDSVFVASDLPWVPRSGALLPRESISVEVFEAENGTESSERCTKWTIINSAIRSTFVSQIISCIYVLLYKLHSTVIGMYILTNSRKTTEFLTVMTLSGFVCVSVTTSTVS